MIVYNYDPTSLQYLGASDAFGSPLEPGSFLVPQYSTPMEPPTFDAATSVCCFVDGAWVVSPATTPPSPPPVTLAAAQTTQLAALSAACATQITAGFASSALGADYTYPSTLTDQTNHNTIAANTAGGLLWCETGSVWSFKQHTQAQAQAVVADFTSWLNTCQSQLAALSASVSGAASLAAVLDIVWTVPQTGGNA